jgi:hypothetical protein
MNYAIVAYRSSMRRWRAARPRASGECQDTRRSNRRCATAISTRSVFPESMRPPKLNSVEPPRHGSVCQVVWEGRCREASPPLSRSLSGSDIPLPTGWRRADYTDWLGKPHDAGAFRSEVRWSDASRPRHAQVADRRSPVYSLLTNAA